MKNDQVVFTVVTVCFNAQDSIAETIESVLNQSYKNYEYIVMDGFSTDRTVEITLSYRMKFEQNGVEFAIVSEKDSGIYNAMNKAVRMATGKWIVFMNSGDRFYSHSVLESVAAFLLEEDSDIVVGDMIIRKNDLYMYKSAIYSGINHNIDICHQSTYTRAKLLKNRPYDEKYRYAADRDFFLYASSTGAKIDVLHQPLSIYLEGGVSASAKGNSEISSIDEKYGVPSLVINKKTVDRNNRSLDIKRKLYKLLPECVSNRREQQKMIRKGWSKKLPGGNKYAEKE